MKLSIHRAYSKPNAMNWKQTQKTFPQEVAIIQQWFDEKTGTSSKLPFYDQPVWQNDLVLLALYEKCGLKIEIDAKWVDEKKQFRYIYAILDNEKKYLPPKSHYDTRLMAELHALVHSLEYVKHKREESEQSAATV